MLTSRSRSTDQRYFGVVEAIVEAIIDDPEKEGRIKVRFPWFDDTTVTEWCRVAHMYSGNGYGSLFTPEVGTEVVVGFVHGDMRLPIILGCLYNGQDKPPTQRAGDKDEKVIHTKGGHKFILDDTSGEEKIVLEDSTGNDRIEISASENSITIESIGGKLILKGQTIEISADANFKINAGGTLDVKGATINLN